MRQKMIECCKSDGCNISVVNINPRVRKITAKIFKAFFINKCSIAKIQHWFVEQKCFCLFFSHHNQQLPSFHTRARSLRCRKKWAKTTTNPLPDSAFAMDMSTEASSNAITSVTAFALHEKN